MAYEWDRSLFAKVKAPKKTELDLKHFEGLIEKTIVEAKKDIGFKKKKSFSPSSFGGQGGCPVYWKIAFNGAEFKFDPDALGVYAMEAGTHYGDLLESRLLASAVANETQGKIENSSPPIFGYLDFTGTINGVDYVCDIKTVTADKWNKIKETGVIPQANFVQVLIYMRILKYRNGILLYVNKDSGKMLTVPITISERNKKFVEYLFNWMNEVYEWKDKEEYPSRGYTKSTWQCKSCPVKETCWELDIPKKVGPGRLEIDIDKVDLD